MSLRLPMLKSLACVAVLSWSTLSAAAALEDVEKKLSPSKKSEFPILESGYWTCESGSRRCIYWLDNERIIFNGSRPDDIELTSDGRRVWRHAIYIWNLK